LAAVIYLAAAAALERYGTGVASATLLAAAAATRVDGVAAAALPLHHSMRTVAAESILYVRSRRPGGRDINCSAAPAAWRAVSAATTSALLPGLLNVLACLGPFFAFQWFNFQAFCKGQSSAKEPLWCGNDPPLSYLPALTAQEAARDARFNLVQYILAAPALGNDFESGISCNFFGQNM
jgi:hypothetical protein